MINQQQTEVELSLRYFEKCSELALIQQPFSLKRITQQTKTRDLQTQFELIRALTETKRHRAKLRINSIIQNKKNRYPQQSVYQHSRVVLQPKQSQQITYINANMVDIASSKRIIITQAPLQTTQTDFQSMMKQQQITCVIMLCNIIESGKIRCFDYLANRNKKVIKQIEGVAIVTEVEIPAENEEPLWRYTQIHYTQWPDRGIPSHPFHLKKVLELAKEFSSICIHCSAGLGRSGVLASILLLQEQIERGEKVSVFGTVRRIRESRFGAVQNSQQYRFIYEYLCQLFGQHQ